MNILGLDLSTKSSGWSIFSNGKLIKYGCITASSANLFNRIDKMVAELEPIIVENKINHVYIENVIPEDVRGNQAVFDALKYLQGFVLHLLNKYNLKHTFYTASEWRAKCGIHTGRGIKRDSLKPKDIAFVKNQFGIQVNDDIADAICIGWVSLGEKPKVAEVVVTEDGFEFE